MSSDLVKRPQEGKIAPAEKHGPRGVLGTESALTNIVDKPADFSKPLVYPG